MRKTWACNFDGNSCPKGSQSLHLRRSTGPIPKRLRIIYTPKQIQGPGFEITECPFNTQYTEWNWSSYPMWSKTVTNDVAGFTPQCVIDECSRWFSATERKIKPVGLSVEKQETLLCKMFELKRNRFFWIFSLWTGDDISNILRAVTDPKPKNNTDNLIQHLIK